MELRRDLQDVERALADGKLTPYEALGRIQSIKAQLPRGARLAEGLEKIEVESSIHTGHLEIPARVDLGFWEESNLKLMMTPQNQAAVERLLRTAFQNPAGIGNVYLPYEVNPGEGTLIYLVVDPKDGMLKKYVKARANTAGKLASVDALNWIAFLSWIRNERIDKPWTTPSLKAAVSAETTPSLAARWLKNPQIMTAHDNYVQAIETNSPLTITRTRDALIRSFVHALMPKRHLAPNFRMILNKIPEFSKPAQLAEMKQVELAIQTIISRTVDARFDEATVKHIHQAEAEKPRDSAARLATVEIRREIKIPYLDISIPAYFMVTRSNGSHVDFVLTGSHVTGSNVALRYKIKEADQIEGAPSHLLNLVVKKNGEVQRSSMDHEREDTRDRKSTHLK